MRLRSGMVVTVLAVTAITVGLAFTAVSFIFNHAQRQELDTALLEVARSEALEARANRFRFSSRPGPAANDVGPLTKFGVIYDSVGNVVSATEPFDKVSPPLMAVRHAVGQPFDLRFASQHLRCVIVSIPDAPDKLLLLAASREDLDGDEAFLNRAMLVAFILAVAWAGMLARWMVRRQLRHHESLARVARRVAGGDLNARVHTLSGDPEFAQLGQDVDAMIEQLSTLMSAQQRFIAHAAHELRSPLAALYGELQQALRKPRDIDSYRETIRESLRATRRLNQLADDLLTLARPKSIDGSPTNVPVAEVFADAIDLVQTRAREKSVRVDVEVGAETVIGRPRNLQRMFRNPIENAIDHAPGGGAVRVAAMRCDGMMQLSVEDHGPGIPPEERGRIFEPFYRYVPPPDVATRGAGLGLAIAREIARAHGGDIRIEDTLDRTSGVQFIALIPCVTDDAPRV